MKVICKVTGGSRMYGLQTPESDTDIRGVFLNTDPAIINLAWLEYDFKNRIRNFTFDIDFANQICLEFYLPFLQGGQE
jgi:predicted nucleotidyltransferase